MADDLNGKTVIYR